MSPAGAHISLSAGMRLLTIVGLDVAARQFMPAPFGARCIAAHFVHCTCSVAASHELHAVAAMKAMSCANARTCKAMSCKAMSCPLCASRAAAFAMVYCLPAAFKQAFSNHSHSLRTARKEPIVIALHPAPSVLQHKSRLCLCLPEDRQSGMAQQRCARCLGPAPSPRLLQTQPLRLRHPVH